MKKIKKNQVIITALAIMIAVAGYINYTGNLSDIISVKDTKDASSDGVVIDENTGEIVNNDAEPDDNSLMEPGRSCSHQEAACRTVLYLKQS